MTNTTEQPGAATTNDTTDIGESPRPLDALKTVMAENPKAAAAAVIAAIGVVATTIVLSLKKKRLMAEIEADPAQTQGA